MSIWRSGRKDEAELNDCAYSEVACGELRPSDTLTYYGLLRDYVKHEDNLINIRQTWSLGIHAFLLSTYGLLFTRGVDLLLKLPDLSEGAAKRFEIIISLLLAPRALIAFVGFYVGYSSRKAIRAAHLAIIHLSCIAHNNPGGHLPIKEKSMPSDRVWLLPKIVGGGTVGGNTIAARKYYLQLPLLLTTFWFILCVGSGLVAMCSFAHRDRFYSDFSKPNNSHSANSSAKN